jgi:hypothetical protein
MDQDFISLNINNRRRSDRSDQNDAYQDYIDNIDDEYKDINRFITLSIDDPQSFDSSDSDSLGEVPTEIFTEAGISKSQIKKARKEAKRLRKETIAQESLDRHDDAVELVKILNKSKGFLDKYVVEYL